MANIEKEIEEDSYDVVHLLANHFEVTLEKINENVVKKVFEICAELQDAKVKK